jgi:hypothetical protein
MSAGAGDLGPSLVLEPLSTTPPPPSPPPPAPVKTTAPSPTKKQPPVAPVCEKWTTAKQEVDAPILQSNIRRAKIFAEDTCFDRVEFVIDGHGPQADRPVSVLADWTDALTEDPSNKPIAIDGTILKVVVRAPMQGYASSGASEKKLMEVGSSLPGKGRIIRAAKFAGSFESQSLFGIGLDKQRSFRVSLHVAEEKTYVWVDIALT